MRRTGWNEPNDLVILFFFTAWSKECDELNNDVRPFSRILNCEFALYDIPRHLRCAFQNRLGLILQLLPPGGVDRV